jgi:hypothetical protein
MAWTGKTCFAENQPVYTNEFAWHAEADWKVSEA